MKLLIIISSLSMAITSCRAFNQSALKEAAVGDNSVSWWGLETIRYDDLPMEKTLDVMPWPGDYWGTYAGGIARRWQAPNNSDDYRDYLYPIPSVSEVKNKQEADINLLSPAEKYDIWVGRSDLQASSSATGHQRQFVLAAAQQSGKDEIPTWTGICNGWALAAIYEKAPVKEVVVKSPSGQTVRFYPDDIKALMSQIYFDYQPQVNIARLGSMCHEERLKRDKSGRVEDEACRDTNPAAFHVALGRYLARGKSFVFDVEQRREVWNQPAYGYRMSLGKKRPMSSTDAHVAKGTVNLVDVRVIFRYVVESEPRRRAYDAEELKEFVASVTYNYTLELDGKDMVIGGEWQKGSRVPDFLWRPDALPSEALLKKIPQYPLSYTKVKNLLEASADSSSTAAVHVNWDNGVTDENNTHPALDPSSAASCLKCELSFDPTAFEGRSIASIKNMVKEALQNEQRDVKNRIAQQGIKVSKDSVLVPVTFQTRVKTKDLDAWFRADPYLYQLTKVRALD